MGDNFIHPKIITKLAKQHGWLAFKSLNGGDHVTLFKKEGHRTVPMRNKIRGRIEALIILKELGIPREVWPEQVR